MNNPITNKIGAVFIRYRIIERARNWKQHLISLNNNKSILLPQYSMDIIFILKMEMHLWIVSVDFFNSSINSY
ncbi:hypothetical protein NDK25_21095 [Niallia taxi]|nr:hypothetical protein [Niallia taxi]MDE5054713.1 hypothetical protein [Niallia taxi]